MSERRGVIRSLLLAAISVAAGVVLCSTPAFGQRPSHPPPPRPAPRPPAHPVPRRDVHPPAQPQQQPPAKAPTETRVQPGGQNGVASGAPAGQGAVIGSMPSGGTAVGTRVNTVPHPPVRPWEQGNIPESERPPPGLCRVWLDKVPASSQPAPTSCARAIQMHP